MEQGSTTTNADSTMLFAGEAWFDPIEAGIRRSAVRGFIQELLEQELTAASGRTRHERAEGEPVATGMGRAGANFSARSAPWSSACRVPG